MVCLTSCVFRSIRFSGFARPHFGMRREGELYTHAQGGGKRSMGSPRDAHKSGDNGYLGDFPGRGGARGPQARAPGRPTGRAKPFPPPQPTAHGATRTRIHSKTDDRRGLFPDAAPPPLAHPASGHSHSWPNQLKKKEHRHKPAPLSISMRLELLAEPNALLRDC